MKNWNKNGMKSYFLGMSFQFTVGLPILEMPLCIALRYCKLKSVDSSHIRYLLFGFEK